MSPHPRHAPAPTRIPQRELRNDVSRILREVENGERFEITVNGRVVAEIGPPQPRRRGMTWQEAHAFIARSRRVPDPTFWDDIASMRQPYHDKHYGDDDA